MTESNRIEYKQELTDGLEKEVVAFLNYHEGGVIYIGVDPDGTAIGLSDCDSIQLKIKDRLRHNILPSCLGLFDIALEERDSKKIIKITIAAGPEKPYYLKKNGMSERGCFIRIGSASEPMPVAMIEELFSRRTRNSIGKMISPRSDLNFEQLKIYYQEKGLKLNDNFLNSLELLTPEGKLNYAAYLLADENSVSIKVARYSGKTRVDLVENSEYGNCSLIKAVHRVLDRMEVENKTFAKITFPKRLEQRLIEASPLREAVINAVIHNDYSNGAPPKFEFFADRMEITSMGGLPFGVQEEDFFAGLSAPRNKELMRVFRDVDLVEQLGSGISRILEKYDRQVFTLSESYLRVTFLYHEDFLRSEDSDGGTTQETPVKAPVKASGKRRESVGKASEKTSEKTSEKMLRLLKSNSGITIAEMAVECDVSTRSIERNLKTLQKQGKLERIGPDKGGHWEVIE